MKLMKEVKRRKRKKEEKKEDEQREKTPKRKGRSQSMDEEESNMKMLRQLEETLLIANKAGETPVPRKKKAAYNSDADEDDCSHCKSISERKRSKRRREKIHFLLKQQAKVRVCRVCRAQAWQWLPQRQGQLESQKQKLCQLRR